MDHTVRTGETEQEGGREEDRAREGCEDGEEAEKKKNFLKRLKVSKGLDGIRGGR